MSIEVSAAQGSKVAPEESDSMDEILALFKLPPQRAVERKYQICTNCIMDTRIPTPFDYAAGANIATTTTNYPAKLAPR